MKVTVTARARADIQQFRQWYRRIRLELASEAIDDIAERISVVSERPHAFPEIKPGIRRALCNRFPYKIYYRIRADELRILAIYHASRHPRQWDRR